MKAKLTKLSDYLGTSLWLVPAVMALLALGASVALVLLDESVDPSFAAWLTWAYGGGAEGARAVLSTIAGSMITVAGVTFSITIVALTLASQQFGPRLLRNFMRDLGNKIVLGTFIATFLYCLLVLRTVRGTDGDPFVPHLSVTFGVLLAIGSLGVLIYFIHHIAESIQAGNVIASVSRDFENAIDRLFPEKIGEAAVRDDRPPSDLAKQLQVSRPVTATGTGYLQAVDPDELVKLAQNHDVIIRLERRPGHFIVLGGTIASVFPGERVTKELSLAVNENLVLGTQRTSTQDAEFAVEQLVEIALRALSPGVNDPFTAINCIDRLAAGLCRLAERETPSAHRYDAEGALRVLAEPVSFSDVVDSAFNQIRQYGRSSIAVTIRLLDALRAIAHCVRTDEGCRALLRQAEMIERGQRNLSVDQDRRDIAERYQAVVAAVQPRLSDAEEKALAIRSS